MSIETKRNDSKIIIEAVKWKNLDDNGLTLILQDNNGNELKTDLTSSLVLYLVDMLLKTIEIKNYSYERKKIEDYNNMKCPECKSYPFQKIWNTCNENGLKICYQCKRCGFTEIQEYQDKYTS